VVDARACSPKIVQARYHLSASYDFYFSCTRLHMVVLAVEMTPPTGLNSILAT